MKGKYINGHPCFLVICDEGIFFVVGKDARYDLIDDLLASGARWIEWDLVA